MATIILGVTGFDPASLDVYAAQEAAIISFDSNKPSNASTDIAGTMADQALTDEDTNLSSLGYSLPGYDFMEWNTAKDGSGTSYSDGATVNGSILNTNTVLYAQWQPKSYTVTYDANGGIGAEVSQTLHFDQHEKLNNNTYEKEGLYTFICWTSDASGTQHLFENGDTVCNIGTLNPDGSVSDITLVAQWIHDGYTVVIVTDNDEGVTELVADNPRRLRLRQNDSEYSGFEESSTIPGLYILEETKGELPSGEYNIIFDGYDTGRELVTKEGSAFLEYCTVEMNDADFGGKAWLVDSYDNRVKRIEHVLEGRSIDIEAITESGYKFDSYSAIGIAPSTWNPADANQSIEIAGEVMLVAHSIPNSYYYIEFNPNGAESGLMSELKCYFDEPSSLPACEYSFTNHRFTGWNTSADGSGTAYADRQDILNITSEEGAHILLYAQWARNAQGSGSDDGSNENADIDKGDEGRDKGVDTGDNTNLFVSFVIMLISLIGSIVAIVYRKKKSA